MSLLLQGEHAMLPQYDFKLCSISRMPSNLHRAAAQAVSYAQCGNLNTQSAATHNTPDSTTVLLSTSSVIWVELSNIAPPLLLSMAVTLDPTALFSAALVTVESMAMPATASHAQSHCQKLLNRQKALNLSVTDQLSVHTGDEERAWVYLAACTGAVSIVQAIKTLQIACGDQ